MMSKRKKHDTVGTSNISSSSKIEEGSCSNMNQRSSGPSHLQGVVAEPPDKGCAVEQPADIPMPLSEEHATVVVFQEAAMIERQPDTSDEMGSLVPSSRGDVEHCVVGGGTAGNVGKSPQSAGGRGVRAYTRHPRKLDPILEVEPGKTQQYSLYPIKYDTIWAMYKKQVDSFWKPEEVNPSLDLSDWQQLTQDERNFISYVLAFFANSDGIVAENLAMRFYNDCKPQEFRCFYSMQLAMEAIHGETYSMLIDTYIPDKETKDRMFNAIDNYACIRRKAAWAQKYITASPKFPPRLVAFICVEGIFFSSSFCAIYWLKKRGLMVQGLGFSNELIARDEALHCEFGVEVYRLLEHKATRQVVAEIIREAVDIEIEFVKEALQCELIGMSADLMIEYVKFCADRIFLQLGFSKRLYDAQNPFDWMEMISMDGKTNFFEKRVSEYAMAPGAGSASASAASAAASATTAVAAVVVVPHTSAAAAIAMDVDF